MLTCATRFDWLQYMVIVAHDQFELDVYMKQCIKYIKTNPVICTAHMYANSRKNSRCYSKHNDILTYYPSRILALNADVA